MVGSAGWRKEAEDGWNPVQFAELVVDIVRLLPAVNDASERRGLERDLEKLRAEQRRRCGTHWPSPRPIGAGGRWSGPARPGLTARPAGS